MRRIRLAVPDLVSNSYFSAIAAYALGFFENEGLEAELTLLFPNHLPYEALRDGSIDLVAGPAHAALLAFPNWHGVRLLSALSQGTVWVLVMRADLDATPGDPSCVLGRTIGAAPLVDLTFKRLLKDAGIDPDLETSIIGVPGTREPGVSFGVAAARALQAGQIDGFWANAMGADNALRSGVGKLVLDVRRGLGPASARHYTFSTLATSERLLMRDRDLVTAGTRAVLAAQRALQANPNLAAEVGQKLFPPREAGHIAEIIARDVAFYAPDITDQALQGLNDFVLQAGLATTEALRQDLIVELPALA